MKKIDVTKLKAYQTMPNLKSKYDIEIDQSVWDNVVDVAGGIGDGVSKLLKVGKITVYVVVGIVALTVVGVAVNLIRNPSNALLATPQGRALKTGRGLRK